ncbi:unnamed protein product [Pleuronectes platessa]|uniref:Uncharacterized protein n=1 Tax=Pleuronectes platessa TaxID=8262 RepID=A0A9N7W2T1_PLEPL|nr:unnamed protein product [Pleuronectes platessa]
MPEQSLNPTCGSEHERVPSCSRSRSVGKVTTPETRGPLFEQQALRGQLGVRGVTAFILPSSSSSSFTAGGLRTPSDHRTEAKVELTPAPPPPHRHLISLQPPPSLRSHPSPSLLAPHSPRRVPFVHLLSWRPDCH